MHRTSLVIAAICCFGTVVLPASGYAASRSSDYGTLVDSVLSDRTIPISESTRYVNVDKFETIKFVARGNDGRESSFVWRFDTFMEPTFPFSEIAPADFPDKQPIRVYVRKQQIPF